MRALRSDLLRSRLMCQNRQRLIFPTAVNSRLLLIDASIDVEIFYINFFNFFRVYTLIGQKWRNEISWNIKTKLFNRLTHATSPWLKPSKIASFSLTETIDLVSLELMTLIALKMSQFLHTFLFSHVFIITVLWSTSTTTRDICCLTRKFTLMLYFCTVFFFWKGIYFVLNVIVMTFLHNQHFYVC